MLTFTHGGVRALRGGVVVRDLFRIPGDGPSVAHDAPLAVFDCFDVDDGVIGDWRQTIGLYVCTRGARGWGGGEVRGVHVMSRVVCIYCLWKKQFTFCMDTRTGKPKLNVSL